MSTVVPATLQPEASSRETSLMTFFNPSVISQDSTQPTEAAQLSLQGQPLSMLFPPQQTVTIPIPRSTTVSAIPPSDELTSVTSFTTFSSMASTQPTAAAQPMPGQGVTGLFQPQQAVTIPVPTSTATQTTPLSDELVRGASFTPILRVGSQLGLYTDLSSYGSGPWILWSILAADVWRDWGSSQQLHQDKYASHDEVPLPNRLPAAESGAAIFPEQPIPVTQSEERQVEVSLGTGCEEDPTDQADVNSEADENPMPQLLPTEDMSIVSGDGTEQGRKQKAGQGKMEEGRESKRRRLEDREDDGTIRVSLVAINGLVSAVHGLTGQMKRSEKNEEKIEKALIDTTCALAKVADTLSRFKNVKEENRKEEKRKEERWLERESERRKGGRIKRQNREGTREGERPKGKRGRKSGDYWPSIREKG